MRQLHRVEIPRCSAYFLGFILAAGLLNGLLYVFLVPPWQHYDEPGHFEFAWLIAGRERLPQPEDFDPEMRRQVAASMIEHNFFVGMNTRPNLLSQKEPVWIGISQINPSILYYSLVALPLRVFHHTDITFQLYIARSVSLLFYLATLAAAYGLVAELTPPGHLLRLMLPVTLLLLPGFVDLMTAVSDDVGATAIFSLFLLIGVRIIQRGFSWERSFLLLVCAIASIFTKVTIFVALPLAGIALLFALLRGRQRRLAWIILVLGGIAGLLMILSWGDAAHWARQTQQTAPTRIRSNSAPLGNYVFQIIEPTSSSDDRVLQLLSQDDIQRLRGRTVTIGAWMWADVQTRARLPVLSFGSSEVSTEADLGVEPAFYTFQAQVDRKATRLYLALSPYTSSGSPKTTIYVDGITLIEGKRDIKQAPRYEDSSARIGKWSGRPFTNLLINGSAEESGPWVRNWAERIVRSNFPGQPSLSLALSTLVDWSPASWYYQMTTKNLFQTFWARFGWGHVPLLGGSLAYKLLAAACLASLAGVLLSLFRHQPAHLPWPAILLLAVAGVSLWFPAFMRGIDSLVGVIFIPAARYAFPAIIPTLLLLCVGWMEILNIAACRFRIPVRILFMVYSLSFFGLDILALASLLKFYH